MTTPSPHPLRRLWTYGRTYRGRVAAAAISSFVNKILDIAPPALIGAAVDIVVERNESWFGRVFDLDVRSQIVVLAGVTVTIWILESITEYAHGRLWRGLAQTVQHDLRVDAYRHVQGLELAYFEDRSTGGLMTILGDDINQLERFLDTGANDLLQVAVTVLVIGSAFFVLAPEVAWMAVAPMPLILWGSFAFQKRIGPRYARMRERAGLLNARLSGNLSGIATIQSFTAEEDEIARIDADSRAYGESNRNAIVLSAAFSPLVRMAVLTGFAAMLVFGGFLALDGQLAVGAYSVMIFLTQRLLWPLTRLATMFDLYQRAMASTDRVLDLLDTPAGITGGTRPLPTDEVRGSIEFDAVRFRYGQRTGDDPGALPPVLDGLSLAIEPGQTIGIVGLTGSGKSTLVKVLLRFYEPEAGRIVLDGHDLTDLSIRDVRRAIGLVSQDVFLFDGTVRENIAYGDPDAGDDRLREAARIAEASEFIERLPQGYDTRIGERGQKLSGGQKQRLSIARAVLKDPPILILDEATSSVDNETEAAIQRSLARIVVGRTTLVIAHRLSTVRPAHRIFVVEDGRVAEEGNHESLTASGGIYADLWAVQTGGQALGPLSGSAAR